MPVIQLGYTLPDGSPATLRPGQQAFHEALDRVRFVCLLGGWGAGKSSAGRNEALKRMLLCPGSDGLIIRRTYQELTDSTWLECLQAWAPLIRGVDKEGMTIELKNGSRARFRSARHEGREDPTKFGSVPYTWFWCEEGADLDAKTWAYLKGRIYQAGSGTAAHGQRGWITTNPPEDTHWIHREFVEAAWPDHALVRAATRENADALPEGYIERLETQYDASWVRRYLLGDFGFLQTEHPVFREYRETLHVAPSPLAPLQGRPCLRGWDFGVAYAACVVAQVTPSGCLNLLAGFLGRNEGVAPFAERILEECRGREWTGPWEDFGDPSGWFRDISTSLRPVDYLRQLGIVMKPGEREVDTRLEAVRWFLTTLRDGRALLWLSPVEETRLLRNAFAGGYHFRERPGGQLKRPVKNEYSHPMDALQYLCSRLRPMERSRIVGRRPTPAVMALP